MSSVDTEDDGLIEDATFLDGFPLPIPPATRQDQRDSRIDVVCVLCGFNGAQLGVSKSGTYYQTCARCHCRIFAYSDRAGRIMHARYILNREMPRFLAQFQQALGGALLEVERREKQSKRLKAALVLLKKMRAGEEPGHSSNYREKQQPKKRRKTD